MTITEDDVKTKYGEFDHETLLQAQFEAYLALLKSVPSDYEHIWDGSKTLELSELIVLAVRGYFADLKAGKLSWDATYCKYQWVIPKMGPTVEKCKCPVCEIEEKEQKRKKTPEKSADGPAYELEQRTNPKHKEWGKGKPNYVDHSAPVKAMEDAATLAKELKSKYGLDEIIPENLDALDRARWIDSLESFQVYCKLINDTIADVTKAVNAIKEWYEAYEKAIMDRSRSFKFTLGGRDITWEVTLQPEIERHCPYKPFNLI